MPTSSRSPRYILWLFALPLMLCAGCGGGGGGDQSDVERVGTSLTSWRRSLATAGELWARGAVPRQYLRQLLKAAHEELDSQRQKLDEVAAGADAQQVAQFRSQLDRLQQWHYELSSAAERDDRDAAGWAALALSHSEDEQGGGGPAR